MNQDPAPIPYAKTGRVAIEGDHATLTLERTLRHPPSEVWAALTQPQALAGWYMADARIDGRPDGSVDMHAGLSRFHVTGRILVWDPPRAFEHEWRVAPRAELPEGEDAVIRWELRPVPEGTLLVLTHRRLTRMTALGFAPGTHAYLDRLEAYLDHAPLPNWMQRYEEVRGGYPPMPQPLERKPS